MIKLFSFPATWQAYVIVACFLGEIIKWPWQHRLTPDQGSTLQDCTKVDILIFSKTNGYRHSSIALAVKAITNEALKRGWSIHSTKDGACFNSKLLATVKVVVFLSTTGKILTDDQKRAFENYIESGGGYAGIHSASDTEHHWVWYERLLGTLFKSHTLIPSQIISAEIITEDTDHPATKHLPARWYKKDEWYNFKDVIRNRANVHILLSLNESSYRALWPKHMKGDHPVCWTNLIGKGRMFYTAMGHTAQTFEDRNSLEHIMGGIQWAGDL